MYVRYCIGNTAAHKLFYEIDPVFWIRIQLGFVLRNLEHLDPYSGSTQVKIG